MASSNGSGFTHRTTLKARLTALDSEVSSVDRDIDKLRVLRQSLVDEKAAVLRELEDLGLTASGAAAGSKNANANANGKGKTRRENYMDDFEWSGELLHRAKQVFGIQDFRFCQKGVCNANMDGRDVVCVMPTGGGKSLTYQLPALLTPGTTVVISPLVSLITDQILHLREAGVEAVMLTGGTKKEESREVFNRLGKKKHAREQEEKEIKLCYVTPERIAKSKTFMSLMEKMALDGRLARIVIDEAHCVSSLGHDFRPDYKKLSILRQLFPSVPILALSATCPPSVLKDLLKILKLRPVVDGTSAPLDGGTVYFSSPLYRANLHYSVLPKPPSAAGAIQAMADYILAHHRGESGIVYCLSKKDTQTVADGIAQASKGKIRTGVYHADVEDAEKEGIHRRWRTGQVQVVCATIAFGLGIDKGDVRFVLHHSMSKSLDGFYQESGRAGRDGKHADCVLYYRGQDATRLSSLICGEVEGQEKLHEMLRFAQNLTDCRKLLFARYFSASSELATAAWEDPSAPASLAPCGHCDNCLRPPSTVSRKDVTFQAWQILRVVEEGVGRGAFAVSGGGKGKRRKSEKSELDLEPLGGKVDLSKDDVEFLTIQLILDRYLAEDYHQTAYAVNVYLSPGLRAARLTRLPLALVRSGQREGPKVEGVFLLPLPRKARVSMGAKGKQAKVDDSWVPERKGKIRASKYPPEDVYGDEEEEDDGDVELVEPDSEETDIVEGDDWQLDMRGKRRLPSTNGTGGTGRQAKRRKGNGSGGKDANVYENSDMDDIEGVTAVWEDGQEVYVISP